ncbi:MAG: DUF350 domain-containing protein [Myxococcales bacterium]|nr:DUF350 domain-containing protein [Myxococcales bacterium]
MTSLASELMYAAAALLICAGLLLLGRVAYARLAGYDVDHQLTEADNPAVGTALFGYLGGLVIVFAALLATPAVDVGEPADVAWDLAELAIYGALAIVLLKLSGWLNDRLILHRFENKKELVDDRNVGAGAVLCGSYLASGLVLAGAFSGRVDPELIDATTRAGVLLHELTVALAFYALGQVALALYGVLYQAVTPVNVHDAIERDYEADGRKHGGNMAAGVAFGGNLAALGVLLYGGARIDFTGWGDNLLAFGVVCGVGFVLLPVWRVFVDRVLLGKANLDKEIFEDRNVNAALLETIAMIGLAAVIVLVV